MMSTSTKTNRFVALDDEVDMLIKGNIDVNLPEQSRRISDLQISSIETLQTQGLIKNKFNQIIFVYGDWYFFVCVIVNAHKNSG